MFTGLIETLGTVKTIDHQGTSVVLGILPDMSPFDVREGDSVAIDGICLTIESIRGSVLYFAAVRETLRRTSLTNCTTGRRVNMERALTLGERLDGHMVLGHVDGTGRINNDQDVNGSILRTISVPLELRPFMAEKGSVAIDGISLTIAGSTMSTVTISVIPETTKRTTLFTKKAGDIVNIECDVIARYLYRFTQFTRVNSGTTDSNSLIDKLERFGF
ncbi:MAG: riboflavin synthase [Fibrobacter sp.]|nr:riboflavin synthase [Fibrobacter sp.]